MPSWPLAVARFTVVSAIAAGVPVLRATPWSRGRRRTATGGPEPVTDRRLVVPLVAPVYVTAVACTTGVLDGLLTPGAWSRVVLACSTNVRNLAEGRWSTLVTSALSSSTPRAR